MFVIFEFDIRSIRFLLNFVSVISYHLGFGNQQPDQQATCGDCNTGNQHYVGVGVSGNLADFGRKRFRFYDFPPLHIKMWGMENRKTNTNDENGGIIKPNIPKTSNNEHLEIWISKDVPVYANGLREISKHAQNTVFQKR